MRRRIIAYCPVYRLWLCLHRVEALFLSAKAHLLSLESGGTRTSSFSFFSRGASLEGQKKL